MLSKFVVKYLVLLVAVNVHYEKIDMKNFQLNNFCLLSQDTKFILTMKKSIVVHTFLTLKCSMWTYLMSKWPIAERRASTSIFDLTFFLVKTFLTALPLTVVYTSYRLLFVNHPLTGSVVGRMVSFPYPLIWVTDDDCLLLVVANSLSPRIQSLNVSPWVYLHCDSLDSLMPLSFFSP